MRFVVVGAGAVGGVVGARLAQHGHDVALVARGPHRAAMAAGGLLLRSPDDEVRVTPDGYLVTIPAKSPSQLLEKLFHYDEVRTSGDGQYHACILPGSGVFRCLYVPPMAY